jgi:hypothetical protein
MIQRSVIEVVVDFILAAVYVFALWGLIHVLRLAWDRVMG